MCFGKLTEVRIDCLSCKVVHSCARETHNHHTLTMRKYIVEIKMLKLLNGDLI